MVVRLAIWISAALRNLETTERGMKSDSRVQILAAVAISPLMSSGHSVVAAQVSDPAATLVGRLNLEGYKTTIKGLTQFGDRQKGTDRNRAAVDWIEAQLQSYGCVTERLRYEYRPPRMVFPAGDGRPRGPRLPTGVNTDPSASPIPNCAN